jgi:hypothetical protein
MFSMGVSNNTFLVKCGLLCEGSTNKEIAFGAKMTPLQFRNYFKGRRQLILFINHKFKIFYKLK